MMARDLNKYPPPYILLSTMEAMYFCALVYSFRASF